MNNKSKLIETEYVFASYFYLFFIVLILQVSVFYQMHICNCVNIFIFYLLVLPK